MQSMGSGLSLLSLHYYTYRTKQEDLLYAVCKALVRGKPMTTDEIVENCDLKNIPPLLLDDTLEILIDWGWIQTDDSEGPTKRYFSTDEIISSLLSQDGPEIKYTCSVSEKYNKLVI